MPNDVIVYGLNRGFDCAAAVTKYRAVKLVSGSPQVVAPIAAAADRVIGIAQDSVTSTDITKGRGATVAMINGGGVCPMEAGVLIHEGDPVVIDSAGRAVPQGTASAGTQVIGTCTLGAASIGLRCSVALGQ